MCVSIFEGTPGGLKGSYGIIVYQPGVILGSPNLSHITPGTSSSRGWFLVHSFRPSFFSNSRFLLAFWRFSKKHPWKEWKWQVPRKFDFSTRLHVFFLTRSTGSDPVTARRPTSLDPHGTISQLRKKRDLRGMALAPTRESSGPGEGFRFSCSVAPFFRFVCGCPTNNGLPQKWFPFFSGSLNN